MVIAIDGPGGVGKSTVTRRIAMARGLDYLDTGATYRAAALAAMRAKADLDDTGSVVCAVQGARIEYQSGAILLDGDDVSIEIRTPEVTAASSVVAAIPGVRAIVVAMQRAWVEARNGEAVVEGRDIGTVVFPHAATKIFLTARPEIRAARRALDLDARGVDAATVQSALEHRDRADSTRQTSPLRPAEDAHIIDTSELTLEEVIADVLEIVDHERDRPQIL